MFLSGDIQIIRHNSTTRGCEAVAKLDDSTLAVWDKLDQEDLEWDSETNTLQKFTDSGVDRIEPDILIPEDKWEGVERKGHDFSKPLKLSQMSEESDTDMDNIPDI